jgi:hypothetical protein
MLAVMIGMKPRDGLEGMLIAQLIATYTPPWSATGVR